MTTITSEQLAAIKEKKESALKELTRLEEELSKYKHERFYILTQQMIYALSEIRPIAQRLDELSKERSEIGFPAPPAPDFLDSFSFASQTNEGQVNQRIEWLGLQISPDYDRETGALREGTEVEVATGD